jgi:hypothetical protein
MRNFEYIGTNAIHTVIRFGNEVKEISLYAGNTYSLPSSDAFVKSLVAQKKLKLKSKIKKQ